MGMVGAWSLGYYGRAFSETLSTPDSESWKLRASYQCNLPLQCCSCGLLCSFAMNLRHYRLINVGTIKTLLFAVAATQGICFTTLRRRSIRVFIVTTYMFDICMNVMI